MTFVATWEAVSQAGAVPVPVDVSELDYNLDPERSRPRSARARRAIMPVHLYGQMADMDAPRRDSRSATGIPLVEDAAQAHGAERDGRRAGATGHASGFSFYPGKNLGAMGDAGALVTNDAGIAARVRALREHGQDRKYHHDEIGWTARLDTIQAAVLSRKLPLLDGWNDERRAIAALYARRARGRRRSRAAVRAGRKLPGLAPLRRPDGRSRGLGDHLQRRTGSARDGTIRSPPT